MVRDFDLEQLIDPLVSWFSDHARTLPWRSEPTPYRVWVSEIMLQQTRVEAVKPYFARFIERLPDVEHLAACPEDELLKLWEGLGYYNRVRNMQKAAVRVTEQYGGRLPADYQALLQLPGIGSYTAGAIASIAYGLAEPAVDGNVLRILTRVTADDTDIMKQSFRREVEDALRNAMRSHGAGIRTETNFYGTFNQALMELGATVCVPNGMPLCEECPWNALCLAKEEGRIAELPVKTKAKARRIEERTVLIIREQDKVAIRKRPDKGLLAGLYELPNLSGHLTADEVLAELKAWQYRPLRIQKLGDARHIFSHVEWHMTGYAVRVEDEAFSDGKMCAEKPGELFFVEAEDARERYAIPSAFAAYAEYLNIKIGIG